MPETGISLLHLHTAYEEWLGRPNALFELRTRQADKHVPSELDLLLFQPPNNEKLPDEEQFTYIATAGLSTCKMPRTRPLMEVIIRVDGAYPFDVLEELGRKIAEIAVLPFREKNQFYPNLLIYPVQLPLFEGMGYLLVTNWAVESEKWLFVQKRRVLMLNLIPLFESEAQIVGEIGDREASRRFLAENINWYNPKRAPAHLGLLPLDSE